MSRTRLWLTVAALTITPTLTTAAQTPARTPLEGVWNYVGASQRGQAIYHGNSYMMLLTLPDSGATTRPPSEADQARMFRNLNAQAGTFSISDTTVTMHQMHARNPRAAATTWRFNYTIKGDTMQWRVLNAQGQVTSSGASVRAPGTG